MQRVAVAVIAGAVLVAVPVFGQTVFVQDTFTAASNQLLEAHAPDTGGAWTRYVGGSGLTVNAAADNLRNVAGGDWNLYGNATVAPDPEHMVRQVVTFTNASVNSYVDLFGRANALLVNGYLARVDSAGAFVLYRVSGGVVTVLASGSTAGFSINAPHTIVLMLLDSAKELWIDGVLVASSADNTVTAAGLVGLGMSSNNAAQVLVDDFVASTFSPTAARFVGSRAAAGADGVVVEWTTSQERDNLGFNVYRASPETKNLRAGKMRLTPDIIAGSAFLAAGGIVPAGNSYRWLDPDAPDDAVYWIEEIDLSGARQWHGPIVAQPGSIEGSPVRSPTLRELGQRIGVEERGAAMRAVAMAAAVPGAARQGADPLAVQRSLARSRAVKIGVRENGWIRIPRSELLAAGLRSAATATSLRLFADGVEVPITVETDRKPWSAIRFYATALDTPSTDTRVYWLVSSAGSGLRIPRVVSPAAPPNTESSFQAVAERSDKVIFFAALRNGDAESFFGPLISSDPLSPTLQQLDLSNVDTTAAAEVTVTVQGASRTPHRVGVSLNGTAVGEISLDSTEVGTGTFTVPGALLVEGENSVALTALNGEQDVALVMSVRIAFGHAYRAEEGRLLATVPAGRSVVIDGLGSGPVCVLDVTDPGRPVEIAPRSRSEGAIEVTAPGSGRRTIVATSAGGFSAPAWIARNAPSSLYASRGADLLVIAPRAFLPALDPLLVRRRAQGRSVLVAAIDDVYDEMSFGAKDPAAIRDLVTHATTRWRRKPRWILLAGDASFDPRDYLGYGETDFVPTTLVQTDHLKTASDVTFADRDGDGGADVAMGRLPARSKGELAALVEKILDYENGPADAWADRLVLVSDDDAQIGFREMSDEVAEGATGYDVVDVDVASMGTAAARQLLLSELEDGASIVNFIGHGSVEVWSESGLFGRSDALASSNGTRLPVVVAMTCLNGYFHDLYTESLAEAWLRSPSGGAVAVLTSSAMSNADTQVAADAVMIDLLANRPDLTVGDAALAAQRAAGGNTRRSIILFGDPSMRLKRQ